MLDWAFEIGQRHQELKAELHRTRKEMETTQQRAFENGQLEERRRMDRLLEGKQIVDAPNE